MVNAKPLAKNCVVPRSANACESRAKYQDWENEIIKYRKVH
jgi:hypothetical protein